MHTDHDHGFPARPVLWEDERGTHQRVDWEARRTTHKRHRKRGGQAGLRVFDSAGGEDAGDRASEA